MLGATVPAVGGLHRAFVAADAWECDCVQIYLTRSRTWETPPLSDDGVERFHEAQAASHVRYVVSHVPYLVNLAASDEALRTRSVQRLIIEIDHARQLRVPYVVLHPGTGKVGHRGEATEWIIDGLKRVLCAQPDDAVMILLETMAGQGSAVGSRFEEIAVLLDGVGLPGQLEVCFDTAHVFAAGYDIAGYDGYERTLAHFDNIVGIERIRAIHLNDSKVPLGARVDRHDIPGQGFIGAQMFHAIVRDSRLRDTPMILETPDPNDSPESLRYLRSLMTQDDRIEGSLPPRQTSLF